MVMPMTRALKPPPPTKMMPCTIVTASPLTIALAGATVPASKVLGLTYTPGAPAVCFLNPADLPVVFPIG